MVAEAGRTTYGASLVKCQPPHDRDKHAKCEFYIKKPNMLIPPIVNVDKIAWIDFPPSTVSSIAMDKNYAMFEPYGKDTMFMCEVETRINDQKVIHCHNYGMECINPYEHLKEIEKLKEEIELKNESIKSLQSFAHDLIYQGKEEFIKDRMKKLNRL